MNETTVSQSKASLMALAVLGQADAAALAALLGRPPPSATWTRLRRAPGVVEEAGILRLAPDQASDCLAELANDDPVRFRRLHTDAVDHLAERLRTGDETLEPAFLRVFERLADVLVADAPQRFIALVDTTRDVPLATAAGRHLHRYYEGLALRKAERYTDALAVFDRLLAAPALDTQLHARTLNSRAICCRLIGRPEEALAGYRKSLRLWRELGDRLYEGKVLLNMAIIAYDLQKYDDAHDLLHAAASCFETIGSSRWLAVTRNELGLVYRDQGRWQDGLACFRSFVAQRRSEGAHDDVGLGLNNIGEVLLFQGRLDEAAATFRDALDTMTTRLYRIDTYLHLGLVYQAQGDLERAQQTFDDALELAQAIDRRDILPQIHYRLNDVLHRRGETRAALAQAEAGVDVVEATRAPLHDEDLKIRLLGRWQQVYDAAVLRTLDLGRVADALEYVERATSRAFLDMVARVHTPVETLPADTPLSAGDIQARLPAGTAVVVYYSTGVPGADDAILDNLPSEHDALRACLEPPEHLLAFVVTAERLDVVELPASARRIRAQHFVRTTGRLRGTAPLAGHRLRPLRRWQDLRAQLLEPLASCLADKRHVFLVPHSVLHYLPLHALTGDRRTTGTEGATYSYAPSASVLFNTMHSAPGSSSEVSCLTVGVDADGLAHAEAEARWIAEQLTGTAMTGDAATPDAVRDMLRDYNVIHFSCHGRFRRRRPMDSALVLANGELTAADILTSIQLDADLVILSACDTGLNRVAPGDELLGLPRAFLGAGARSLLVTLWPVHEVPTRLFMERFYREWMDGSARAEAVTAAQRYLQRIDAETLGNRLTGYGLPASHVGELVRLFVTMLPDRRPFDHPYYWGAFVLIGDPR